MIGARSLLASAWMGIQHDLAWTTPPLSLLLRAVAPFASAMTTCIIYWFGTSFSQAVTFSPSRLAFVLVGSTLYAHVATYAWVPTVAIAEGKNLSVFPHIYLTARTTATYLAGRTLSAFFISVTTSMLALAFAFYTLGSFIGTTIPLVITPATVAMLGLALVLNIPGALALGYLLGAYSLYASKFEWSLPGYVAGLLMVFSGALFSPSILPWPLSSGAAALPYTQFISAARDAIAPSAINPASDYAGALFYCVVGGLLLLAVGLLVYFAAERRARRDGVIDRRLA
jgi:ABC-type polysaccharide/polyol phosphate export permease